MSTAVGLSVSFDLLRNESVPSMRCGESVLPLVALWCAGKRLLFSFPCPVIALSIVTTSHALAQVKRLSELCRTRTCTFAKFGGGAMGSRFREQLTHWTIAAVVTQPDQWEGFLSAMVTAHEADLLYMRNFLEEITKNKNNQGGLTLKDLKPDTFREQREEQVVFPPVVRRVVIERIDQDFEKVLRLAAQVQEWDKDKFIAEAQQEYRLGAEKIAEFDKHFHLAMKRLTAGVARQIVDTSKTAGEAWYRLTERARRNRHCQSTPRVEATHPDCGIFSLAERDQEVGQRIRSTVSKRADAQRHRQSGVHESGPKDLPQSDGNTSRRGQS